MIVVCRRRKRWCGVSEKKCALWAQMEDMGRREKERGIPRKMEARSRVPRSRNTNTHESKMM